MADAGRSLLNADFALRRGLSATPRSPVGSRKNLSHTGYSPACLQLASIIRVPHGCKTPERGLKTRGSLVPLVVIACGRLPPGRRRCTSPRRRVRTGLGIGPVAARLGLRRARGPNEPRKPRQRVKHVAEDSSCSGAGSPAASARRCPSLTRNSLARSGTGFQAACPALRASRGRWACRSTADPVMSGISDRVHAASRSGVGTR